MGWRRNNILAGITGTLALTLGTTSAILIRNTNPHIDAPPTYIERTLQLEIGGTNTFPTRRDLARTLRTVKDTITLNEYLALRNNTGNPVFRSAEEIIDYETTGGTTEQAEELLNKSIDKNSQAFVRGFQLTNYIKKFEGTKPLERLLALKGIDNKPVIRNSVDLYHIIEEIRTNDRLEKKLETYERALGPLTAEQLRAIILEETPIHYIQAFRNQAPEWRRHDFVYAARAFKLGIQPEEMSVRTSDRLALIIWPIADTKNAFYTKASKEFIETLRKGKKGPGYDIEFHTAKNEEEVKQALLQHPVRSIDLLVLAGHGQPRALSLGGTTESYLVEESLFIDKYDLDMWIELASVKEHGQIFLLSCNVGSDSVANNLVETIATLSGNNEIYGGKKPYRVDQINIQQTNPFDVKIILGLSEDITVKISDTD